MILKNLFIKKTYIQTEYKEEHIEALNEADIPYELVTKIEALNFASLMYFIYSITLDIVVLGSIIYYFFLR